MDKPLALSQEDIRMLCHRHMGIGADGIIVIEPSERAVCSMTNYNPDGSEADVSGNGLRCLAKHLYDTGIYPETEMRRLEARLRCRDYDILIENEREEWATYSKSIPFFCADCFIERERKRKEKRIQDVGRQVCYSLPYPGLLFHRVTSKSNRAKHPLILANYSHFANPSLSRWLLS